MVKTQDEIASALMSGLYKLVSMSSGANEGDASPDPFIAWSKPGIPFDPEDFKFAKFMLNGQGADDAAKQADADFQKTQAAGFSRFVDFVPSVDGVVGQKIESGIMRPGSATLSMMYKRILDASQVGEIPEPAGINEQIKKLRDEAALIEEDYKKYQLAYRAANTAMMTLQMKAGYSLDAKTEWRVTGSDLTAARNQAKSDWEIDGHRTEYDNLISEILSLRGKRSPAIWRKEALDNFDALGAGNDPLFGEARLTVPYPGSFASNESGWTTFDFKTENVDELNKSKSTKWAASAGGGWGSFKLGGSAEGSTTETLAIRNTDGFTLKLSIAQVPLIRTWFDPWFLKSEFWRINPNSQEGQENKTVSDGGMPPKGMLIAYPVSAIFIRNVEIGMAELHDESSELVKTLKAEGKGGWGFGVINVGGSYERNSSEKKHVSNLADGKLSVPGLQLIGFLCETMDKRCPSPKEGLNWIGD